MAGENYADKEVLILGGGDGALLAELLAERPEPAHVTMVELDAAVMRAVRDHAPGLARGALDAEAGPRHLTVTGDALAYMEQVLSLYCIVLYCTVCMEQAAADSRTFDIVFGDLTDVPTAEPDAVEGNNRASYCEREYTIPYGQSSAMLPVIVSLCHCVIMSS